MGGLARRATLFNRLEHEAQGRSLLFLAGPGEFLEPGEPQPGKPTAQALSTAYARLPYALGLLAPQEAAMLKEHGLTPPPRWQPLPAAVQVRTFRTPSGVVAILLLPPIDPARPAPPSLLGAVLDQARQARIHADLVVAISPWGLTEERDLLAKAGGAIHLLLGAGPGSGLRGIILDEGRAAWVRGFDRGKSLAVVTIPALPGAGQDAKWLENDSIICESLILDDAVAADNDVEALFEWLEQPR